MAVGATRGTKITVNQLVLAAWKRAGVIDVEMVESDLSIAGKLAYGRTVLDSILDSLVDVPSARSIDFVYVDMVAEQQQYTLDEKIIDVAFDGSYIPAAYAAAPDTAASEKTVKLINRDRWNRLGSKSSVSTPSFMYPHRGKEDSYQITLHVNPMPSEAGKIRLQAQLAPADTSDGASTVDLKSAWVDYVLHDLAWKLGASSNKDPEKMNAIMKYAERAKKRAGRWAADHGPIPIVGGPLLVGQRRD